MLNNAAISHSFLATVERWLDNDREILIRISHRQNKLRHSLASNAGRLGKIDIQGSLMQPRIQRLAICLVLSSAIASCAAAGGDCKDTQEKLRASAAAALASGRVSELELREGEAAVAKCPSYGDISVSDANLESVAGRLNRSLELTAAPLKDSSEELKRLELRYWLLDSAPGRRAEMVSVAAMAQSIAPVAARARLLRGIELCRHDRCADAKADLEFADEQLHSIAALPYLSAARFTNKDINGAVKAFDLFMENGGERRLGDLTVYIGVSAYIAGGNLAKAKQLYALGPGTPGAPSSPYSERAAELITAAEKTH